MISTLPRSLAVLLLSSAVSLTLASFAMQPAQVHPSRPDTCYDQATHSVYENGDSWQISGCAMATCIRIPASSSGPSQMMISFESCGKVGYEPPCYVEENKQAEYPDCCPEVVCPDSEEQDAYFNENNEVETTFRKNETSKPSSPSDFARPWRDIDNDNTLGSGDSSEQQDASPSSGNSFYWY